MHGMDTAGPDISVLVPAHNEQGSLPGLVDEIGQALAGQSFECIVIDDGSSDATRATVEGLMEHLWLRLLVHEGNFGKGAAIRTGLLSATGRIIVLIDADGENDPADIPGLVARLKDGGTELGMVNGRRGQRTHSALKLAASRLANGLRRRVLSDDTHDSGAGLRAIKADVFRRLPYFHNWHRYFPALVRQEGFSVVESSINDRTRTAGTSHYGILDRALSGLVDLPAVYWLKRGSYGRVRSFEQRKTGDD